MTMLCHTVGRTVLDFLYGFNVDPWAVGVPPETPTTRGPRQQVLPTRDFLTLTLLLRWLGLASADSAWRGVPSYSL